MIVARRLACVTLAGVVALGAATSALAVDYNVGSFGAAPFSYGRLNPDGTLTPFTVCSPDTYCGEAPFEFVQSYDPNTLLIHPGDVDLDNTAIAFTSATGGSFTFTGAAYTFDGGSNGVGISLFNTSTFQQTYLGATTPTESFTLSFDFSLAAGDSFILLFDSHGGNAFDATALQGVISSVGDPGNAVPEPASWAMMIAGFGMVGATMRRRKVSISFA